MAIDPKEAERIREELRRTGRRFDGSRGIRVQTPNTTEEPPPKGAPRPDRNS